MARRKKEVDVALELIEECKKRKIKEQDFEAAATLRNLENLLRGIGLTREQKVTMRELLKML
jgi:protein-arginine kinase activator protein McsA